MNRDDFPGPGRGITLIPGLLHISVGPVFIPIPVIIMKHPGNPAGTPGRMPVIIATERSITWYVVHIGTQICGFDPLLDVAEVIIEAASRRTESRGSHYRSDFPTRDDAGWLTNQLVSKRDGQLNVEKRWVGQGWVDQPGDVRIRPWG